MLETITFGSKRFPNVGDPTTTAFTEVFIKNNSMIYEHKKRLNKMTNPLKNQSISDTSSEDEMQQNNLIEELLNQTPNFTVVEFLNKYSEALLQYNKQMLEAQ